MAFSLLGFGPGVLVYTSFYLLAFGSGQILWRMYLNLDSQRYPVKCYADVGERTYGPIAKHLFNILQSVQLVFNVAMLLIMDGQGLAEIIDFKFCYIGLTTFFCIVIACLTHVKVRDPSNWLPAWRRTGDGGIALLRGTVRHRPPGLVQFIRSILR